MDNSEPLIKIRNLSFHREQRVIFSNVDMEIMRGKITAVMGPSGAGKTTLLKLIGGLIRPLEGKIEVAGKDVNSLGRQELYHLRHYIGMLSQNGALFTHLTAFDNVAFPLREHTVFTEEKIHEIVMQKLDAVGLGDAKDLRANELSGGMIRRVALARALALNPMLIMYDEPFTGLDPIALNVILRLIHTVNYRFNMTSILVSHDVAETLCIADWVYLIDGGKIIAQGSPQQLQKNLDPNVQRFINGYTLSTTMPDEVTNNA